MAKFSKKSLDRLNQCDARLVAIFTEVVKVFDCTVLEGYRSEIEQNRLFEQGKTKVKYPNGRHNKKPSLAVDVMPYPVDWQDRERMCYFAGHVMAIAKTMFNTTLRWGGDWDLDTDLADNVFDDLPHYEIRE
jgi:peptidoglycan L-alanyl-D-glutamate endopeptidase CwlK